jgi:hypothetical protein
MQIAWEVDARLASRIVAGAAVRQVRGTSE